MRRRKNNAKKAKNMEKRLRRYYEELASGERIEEPKPQT